MQLLNEIAADEVESSGAEGLDDHPTVVHIQQHVEDLRVESRGELDEKHLPAQLVPQAAGPLHRGDGALVNGEPRAADPAHQGPVHALKGGKVGGVGLHRPTAQNHLPVKGHKHPRLPRGGHGQGGAQIVQAIGEGVLNGELGSGEHHGNGDVAHHVGQHRGGVGHGVGAVGDDHPVVLLPGLVDVGGDELPLLGLDVGGVQVENVLHRQVIAARQSPHVVGQHIPVHAGGQPLFRHTGGDGATRGQK